MYLQVGRVGHTYYSGSEQCHSAAPFLIVAEDRQGHVSATVRQVALRQLGQWMMGFAKIGGKTISLSGAYGQDGLPCDLSWPTKSCDEKYFMPLTEAEAYLFHEMGGGWNDTGKEAEVMQSVGYRAYHIRPFIHKTSGMGKNYGHQHPVFILHKRDGCELAAIWAGSWKLVVIDKTGLTWWPYTTKIKNGGQLGYRIRFTWETLNGLTQKFISEVEYQAGRWHKIITDLNDHERMYAELMPVVEARKAAKHAAFEAKQADWNAWNAEIVDPLLNS